MIKKLNQRIFLLIMVSLSIIILGTILLFTFLNYNNTITTTTSMIDRFVDGEPKRNPNERAEEYEIKPEVNIDGLYNILIKNSIIIQSSDTSNSKEINDYALKISNKNSEKGIVGKYIYKTRKINIKDTNILEYSDLKLDLGTGKMSSDNIEIPINGKELDLLEILLLNKKQIVDREMLANKIWGYNSEAEYNNVEVYVSFLRKKLKILKSQVKIKAVRGIGYKLEVEREK